MNAIRTATAPRTSATPPATAGAFSAADEAFFRITASLFSPSFVMGAGVLLGTYDDEDDEPGATLSSPGRHPVSVPPPAPTSVSA